MTKDRDSVDSTGQRNSFWAFWTVAAAFGTYFCMYMFRKPFTAASFEDTALWGIDFKTVVVSTQVFGYMVSKFIGIKVISEMPPHRRAVAILILIGGAELALVIFGLLPRPWNIAGLFLNGLALGMVFGLVLGFLEGRRVTEALTAGLCASFILADGVTKSLGTWLLNQGISEDWMPSVAGATFLIPLGVCVAVLARTPPPTDLDIEARAERFTLGKADRWALFGRFAVGLSLLVLMYLLITIVRSVRADFAPELWRSLGENAKPGIFTQSEMYVALGVLVINGCAVCIRNNRNAFFVSMATCLVGFLTIAIALVCVQANVIGAFAFMVFVGLGLYLPYVAMHTTVFERILAMTRQRGNLGFLMYVADAFGYLGYVAVMITRNMTSTDGDFLTFFISLCWVAIGLSFVCVLGSWWYFGMHSRDRQETDPVKSMA